MYLLYNGSLNVQNGMPGEVKINAIHSEAITTITEAPSWAERLRPCVTHPTLQNTVAMAKCQILYPLPDYPLIAY